VLVGVVHKHFIANPKELCKNGERILTEAEAVAILRAKDI
jgi:hypothetical protein